MKSVKPSEVVAAEASTGLPQHTPGPWYVDGMWIVGANRALVMSAVDCTTHLHEVPHNLKLAAAASDLLVALRAVLVMWDRGPCPKKLDESLSWRESDERARELARAAIAKAAPRG